MWNGLTNRTPCGREAIWREVGAGAPAVRPAALLQRGDRGAAVAAVQRKLRIQSDGIYGPGTEEAVRAFQRKQGLEEDGVVGPRTAAALARAA